MEERERERKYEAEEREKERQYQREKDRMEERITIEKLHLEQKRLDVEGNVTIKDKNIMTAKLPKLELKKFDGNILNFGMYSK